MEQFIQCQCNKEIPGGREWAELQVKLWEEECWIVNSSCIAPGDAVVLVLPFLCAAEFYGINLTQCNVTIGLQPSHCLSRKFYFSDGISRSSCAGQICCSSMELMKLHFLWFCTLSHLWVPVAPAYPVSPTLWHCSDMLGSHCWAQVWWVAEPCSPIQASSCFTRNLSQNF